CRNGYCHPKSPSRGFYHTQICFKCSFWSSCYYLVFIRVWMNLRKFGVNLKSLGSLLGPVVDRKGCYKIMSLLRRDQIRPNNISVNQNCLYSTNKKGLHAYWIVTGPSD